MRIRIIGVVISLLFCWTFVGQAANLTPLESLSNLSEKALQLTKAGHYNRAESIMEQFSEQFQQVSSQMVFTMDQVQVITIAEQEARNALANSELSKDDKVSSMVKFRLVLDALVSNHQPLWTQMEDSILGIYNEAVGAAHAKDIDKFHMLYNSFLSQYNLIYPSLKLDVPAEAVLKVDARIQYIDEYRPELVNDPNGIKELEALAQDLQQLFEQSEEDEADPSLWWVITTTGSIIILTLSYVGFRKYKGGQEKQRRYSKKQND
ncbi:MAG TPA: sporulation protein YpjB [Bacillus sp. (in: firmicutes)]|uniref:sporulation protein YpjB n=1 Tax=Bacillus litorisediminis TaxID=2922713 RepID=UPI001FACBE5B|nr:sporulation protein YpjB [Bacillus litorisediminis]HWO78477.1 sporulation protein YpjB [Bacillus sp. (in: firmicutes)]